MRVQMVFLTHLLEYVLEPPFLAYSRVRYPAAHRMPSERQPPGVRRNCLFQSMDDALLGMFRPYELRQCG